MENKKHIEKTKFFIVLNSNGSPQRKVNFQSQID